MLRDHMVHIGPPASYQFVGDPRELWPHERDFNRWLAGNLGLLADCLGIGRLEFAGREVTVGEQVHADDVLGRSRWNGGLRLDLAARDEHGRLVVIEAQFGEGDHDHFGKIITYAHTVSADVAVWIVVGTDPVFGAEQLAALAELNALFAGRRQFHAVAVTLESDCRPEPPAADEPMRPRLRRVDLDTGQFTGAWGQADDPHEEKPLAASLPVTVTRTVTTATKAVTSMAVRP